MWGIRLPCTYLYTSRLCLDPATYPYLDPPLLTPVSRFLCTLLGRTQEDLTERTMADGSFARIFLTPGNLNPALPRGELGNVSSTVSLRVFVVGISETC